jgi:hypothetical protein
MLKEHLETEVALRGKKNTLIRGNGVMLDEDPFSFMLRNILIARYLTNEHRYSLKGMSRETFIVNWLKKINRYFFK